MSRRCEVCGKGQRTGNRVSHSNRKSRRVWKPNLQTVVVEQSGARRRMTVCTVCLRSGRVKRAARVARVSQPA